MKHLAVAFVAGVFFSGVALAQQGMRPGDPDPYANRPGSPNPYATRGGDPNPSLTKPGESHSGRHHRDEQRGASKQKSTGYAKDPHGEHLPYGSGTGTRRH